MIESAVAHGGQSGIQGDGPELGDRNLQRYSVAYFAVDLHELHDRYAALGAAAAAGFAAFSCETAETVRRPLGKKFLQDILIGFRFLLAIGADALCQHGEF